MNILPSRALKIPVRHRQVGLIFPNTQTNEPERVALSVYPQPKADLKGLYHKRQSNDRRYNFAK